MRRLLLAFAVVTGACTSADFDVAQGDPDTGSMQVGDSFVSPPDSAEPVLSDGRPEETMPADACSNSVPTAPCAAATSGYDYQIDTPREPTPVGHLYKGREIIVHTKMPRSGRLRKLFLRMSAAASGIGSGVAGQVKVTAYLRGCTPIPIGTSVLGIQTGEDWAFYFDPTQNSASTVLPVLPAGTDIDFIVTTDSTLYKFNMVGAPRPSTNPHDLSWGQREGSVGGWSWNTSTMLSIAVWTYSC